MDRYDATPKKAAAPKRADDRSRSRPPEVDTKEGWARKESPIPDSVPPCGLDWKCPPEVRLSTPGWDSKSLQRWWDRRNDGSVGGSDGSVKKEGDEEKEEEETDDTDTIAIHGVEHIIIQRPEDLLRNWQVEAELQNQREEIQRRRKKATTSKATSAASTSAASKAAPKAASTGAPLIKARPLPKPRTSTEHVVAKPRPKPRTKSTEHVWTQTTWMMAPKDVVIITEREAGTTWNDAETQTEGILIIKDQGLRGRFGCVAEKGGASSVAAGSDASSSD